jgi:hypothetical protein
MSFTLTKQQQNLTKFELRLVRVSDEKKGKFKLNSEDERPEAKKRW